MNKLLQLHDKVKYHRYRNDIVENAAHYKRYVRLFSDLLALFGLEIDAAKQTPAPARELRENMLTALDGRCFMTDATHKLTVLYALAAEYQHTGSYDSERQVRMMMAQLEGTLSSIHEYIVSGKIGFFLRYPADDCMEVQRFVWKDGDYIDSNLAITDRK